MLRVKPDNRELEDVCNCALLSPPSTGVGNIETVSVHQVTRSMFKDLFLKDTFISAGKLMIACRVKLMLYTYVNPLSCCHAHLACVRWNGVDHASYEDDGDQTDLMYNYVTTAPQLSLNGMPRIYSANLLDFSDTDVRYTNW